jgi:hypothetical protein
MVKLSYGANLNSSMNLHGVVRHWKQGQCDDILSYYIVLVVDQTLLHRLFSETNEEIKFN